MQRWLLDCRRFRPLLAMLAIVVWLALIICGTDSEAQVAVRGELIFTMAGAPIRDGVVVVTDGKIAAVGAVADVRIPDGYEVLVARVVTPGLIDARGTVGLPGIYNVDHDQDQLERSSAIQPELRALDAYNTHEQLVEYIRSFGVTTIHTGHAPGELISGQTMIVKTVGVTVEDAMLVETAAIAATLGPMAQRQQGSPGTRGKMMAMLRQELIKAQEYRRKSSRAGAPEMSDESGDPPPAEDGDMVADWGKSPPPSRDLRLEALGRVLSGELPLLVTAHRAQDIASVLRLADEFSIRIWLDGAAEAYLLVGEIKAADIPVIIHPTMLRPARELENLSFETASILVEAGIPVAMQTSYEGYVPKTRVVLFEAAVAAAHGLGLERALATITSDAARILGINDRVGSIEIGKDGDLALYDGDPMEYTTRCVGVVINGKVVSREPK